MRNVPGEICARLYAVHGRTQRTQKRFFHVEIAIIASIIQMKNSPCGMLQLFFVIFSQLILSFALVNMSKKIKWEKSRGGDENNFVAGKWTK